MLAARKLLRHCGGATPYFIKYAQRCFSPRVGDYEYQSMLETEMITMPQVEEKIRLHFKHGGRDIDMFDEILQQLLMIQMYGELSVDEVNHYDGIMDTFMRRAKKREFPAVRFTVYLNSAAVLAKDFDLVLALCMYGHEVIYEKLEWPDKVNLLDIATKV
jgi:hypothetical protein